MNNTVYISNNLFSETITYERSRLIGFDLRGIGIYQTVTCYHTVYACSQKELKKRVTEWRAYLATDTYVLHRHPRKYVEVIIT